MTRMRWSCVFFFQAEDGIRDLTVTGVQTCALPISFRVAIGGAAERYGVRPDLAVLGKAIANGFPLAVVGGRADLMAGVARQNGRGAGWGKGEVSGGGGSIKKKKKK